MSFTGDIKKELSLLPTDNTNENLSEAMGLLLFSNAFSVNQLRIHSQHPEVLDRSFALLTNTLHISTDSLIRDGGVIYTHDEKELEKAYSAFGYRFKDEALHLNHAVFEDEKCYSAFLRGAFLSGGYVSATDNGYHLELVTPRFSVAKETMTLLMYMDMPCSTVMRRGNHVMYYKDSGAVAAFLKATGAEANAGILISKIEERKLRNSVNRRLNCDTANLDRTVMAAEKQLTAIERLKAADALESLPKALKETANMRLQYPELSLSELAAMFEPPISRPGLNNRLRRIVAIAEELE